MYIATLDPNIFIIEQDANSVTYQTTTGEKWQITGTCSACGECEVGADDTYYEDDTESRRQIIKYYQNWTGVPVGQPGACLDNRYGSRLDIPVRPEISQHYANCTLSGTYL